jgi:protein-S-isoprenylcysteine O-methyltransferase Ste14
VTRGPFALSRNPIYLGEALILSGLAGIESSAGYAAAAALFVILVTRLAIVREEAHLAARFGAAWEAYAGRVRRWL